MPQSKTDPEEAALAAEVAAEHAAKAVEDAEKAGSAALKAAADPGVKLCPTCNGELIAHGNAEGAKKGAYHCNQCGVCWAPGLKELRYG